jgi:hypothetical protein
VNRVQLKLLITQRREPTFLHRKQEDPLDQNPRKRSNRNKTKRSTTRRQATTTARKNKTTDRPTTTRTVNVCKKKEGKVNTIKKMLARMRPTDRRERTTVKTMQASTDKIFSFKELIILLMTATNLSHASELAILNKLVTLQHKELKMT